MSDIAVMRPATGWDRYMMGWREAAVVVRLKGGPVLFSRPARWVLGFARLG